MQTEQQIDANVAKLMTCLERQADNAKHLKVGDVVCDEFGTRIGDPDLVAAAIDSFELTRAEWDALPESEQISMQAALVAPMPRF